MSIPSKIPTNPIIDRLEKELKKAHAEINYWRDNHADATKENNGLLKELEELKCRLEK
jgi:regulator of replication initiation timing